MSRSAFFRRSFLAALIPALAFAASAQIAVEGKKVFTLAGPPLADGIVLLHDGKIEAVGRRGEVVVPADYQVIRAEVVTPGLIDAALHDFPGDEHESYSMKLVSP